jgi:hypothetical protein
MSRDPTCVFPVDADLIRALEAALGPPIDSYLNGWQVWIEPSDLTGADGEPVELEFRLHPPTGFEQPGGLSHHDLWDRVVEQLSEDAAPLRLGEEERALRDVWVILEVYPAFGEPVSVDDLRRSAEQILGTPALASGRVDHGRLGARWKRSKGRFDLVGALLDDLGVT